MWTWADGTPLGYSEPLIGWRTWKNATNMSAINVAETMADCDENAAACADMWSIDGMWACLDCNTVLPAVCEMNAG